MGRGLHHALLRSPGWAATSPKTLLVGGRGVMHLWFGFSRCCSIDQLAQASCMLSVALLIKASHDD